MPMDIPYSFIAGTTAKANEVNANFLEVKEFVDTLESANATNELNISILQTNKANLNGSSSNRFQVADAINSMDAVNLNTLDEYLANAKYYIGGFELSKQSNTSIRISAGACWDSTYTVMISNSSYMTLSTSGVGANSTQYVYVVWNEDTLSCDCTYSASSTSTNLPSGYEYFRRIGWFTTDDDGNIENVYNEGDSDSEFPGFISGYLNQYTDELDDWEATENCWVFVSAQGDNCTMTAQLDGTTLITTQSSSGRNTSSAISFPVKKGQVVNVTGSNITVRIFTME